MKALKQLFTTGLVALTLAAHGAITSVSVPQESQDFTNNDSYPARDNLWTVSAPPFPFDTSLGIGHILDTSPSALATDIDPLTRLGVLHSHKYQADYVPVSTAIVTYTFDGPTVVDALEILQHFDGVTRIEGFVGYDLGSMVSIGNIFGPAGDVKGTQIFTEGESNVFDFNNSLSGTIFQFRITQTSLANGYGLHRAFPMNPDGVRIVPVPEPSALAPLTMALIGVFLLRIRESSFRRSTSSLRPFWNKSERKVCLEKRR
jgi:hypothetical protein